MKLSDLQKYNLPDSPGVYFFLRTVRQAHRKQAQDKLKKKEVLYIGKATSLKDRVRSYFAKDVGRGRGGRIVKMVEEATALDFIATDSVLEALLLETNEIKKHQPPYNVKEKDDKSFNYVVITKEKSAEDFPRVLVMRGRDIELGNRVSVAAKWGPFPHGSQLREAMKIIRRIFPYMDDKCRPGQGRPCFNRQIGLCPGVCTGEISQREYKKQIKHIALFLSGKKSALLRELNKQMMAHAKARRFEEADKVKKTIFALNHIRDVALLKKGQSGGPQKGGKAFRIEAYDIAHIAGQSTVGVMVVVEDGELNKSQYRKFKIKHDKNDDTANLREVLSRRLNHQEWPMPNMIVVDGGIGQINAAKSVLKENGLNIDVVSVVKDDKHKARDILNSKGQTLNTDSQGLTLSNSILLANSEAHRFAVGYHRALRGKNFLKPPGRSQRS